MLKSRINIILPIALAAILPGLSFLSNLGFRPLENTGLFLSWVISSTFLYVLWYLLWYLWDQKSGYKRRLNIFLLVVFIGIAFGVNYLLVLKSIGVFRLLFIVRIALASILFLAVQYALQAQQNISRLMLEW
jgi:hypothetical protein